MNKRFIVCGIIVLVMHGTALNMDIAKRLHIPFHTRELRDKEKEITLKEKEIALKEREIRLQEERIKLQKIEIACEIYARFCINGCL